MTEPCMPSARGQPRRSGCGTAPCAGRSGARWRAEEGGATLVALGLVGFVMLAGMLAVDVGALAAGRAAAQTAADMAALAALTPGAGPAEAAGIAAANGAELTSCDCSAVQAMVAVRRRVPLAPTGLSVRVTARAKAVLGVPVAPTRNPRADRPQEAPARRDPASRPRELRPTRPPGAARLPGGAARRPPQPGRMARPAGPARPRRMARPPGDHLVVLARGPAG
jgi:hypothetical protein